jgi:hypothetical protein
MSQDFVCKGYPCSLNPDFAVKPEIAGRRNLGAAKASVCEVSKWLSTNVKVEELIDARLI